MTNRSPAPWEDFPEIWGNKSAFFTYLRGAFRRAWNKSPVKIKKLQQDRFKISNPSNKGKREIWGAKCEMCGDTFPMKDVQVDHKIEAGSLNDFSDIEGFVTRLLACSKDDLRIVCKPCHSVLTLANRIGVSFEQAKKEKLIIERCKQKVATQKKELLEAGFKEEDISNAEKRRECYRRMLGGENE